MNAREIHLIMNAMSNLQDIMGLACGSPTGIWCHIPGDAEIPCEKELHHLYYQCNSLWLNLSHICTNMEALSCATYEEFLAKTEPQNTTARDDNSEEDSEE